MATAERYITAQSGAVRLALRDLDTLWSRTQAWDPLARRQLLEEAWPLLIERYGEITATLAADRFEEVTGMPAVLADSVNIEQANARMRWGLEPLFGGAGDGAALGRLAQIADELVKQPGRDTLIQSAARNGIRYARVPSGKRTCAFCLMLASRGAVYANKGSAGNARKFHGQCVVAGTEVSGPHAVAASAREYEGEVVTLAAGGKELSVTPNHPILTLRGWVLAQFVNESDHLIASDAVQRVIGSGPDVYDGPARIEDRFGSLAVEGDAARGSMPGSPEQFHGDGGDSEVHVVARYDLFRDVRDPVMGQVGAKVPFSLGAWECPRHGGMFTTESGLELLFRGANPPAGGGVSGGDLLATFGVSHAGRTDETGGASAASVYPGLIEPASDDGTGHTERLGQGVLTFPGEVSAKEIVRSLHSVSRTARVERVSRARYSGHVYNLSTDAGWYLANSIVTHNCDCRIEPVADDADMQRLKRDGYDPDELRDIYDANKAASSRGAVHTRDTLANIRAEQGTH